MIKASELRIGNIVTLSEKTKRDLWHNEINAVNKYFEVNSIYTDGEVCLVLDQEDVDLCQEDLQPIPLNEEILLKCGFEKELSADNGSVYDLYKINDYEVLGSFHGDPFFFISFMDEPIIKYLHELQNLYFALTGDELEINL